LGTARKLRSCKSKKGKEKKEEKIKIEKYGTDLKKRYYIEQLHARYSIC
jgi:hypothetical protein